MDIWIFLMPFYQLIHLMRICVLIPSWNAQKVYEFLGIQYGLPPIGEQKFRPSKLNETSWNGIKNATKYGPECYQPLSFNTAMSEDCLYLNIWTTNPDSSANLPVMFWIHGGAGVFGAGSDPTYEGTNFTSYGEDIVLVTINYRLGPLGFLASKQLYDEDPNWKSYGGLNGINDQINALLWVSKYIQHFGGNPNHISIFGESEGGLSVCILLISPQLADILPVKLKYAIIESGSCTGPWYVFYIQNVVIICTCIWYVCTCGNKQGDRWQERKVYWRQIFIWN